MTNTRVKLTTPDGREIALGTVASMEITADPPEKGFATGGIVQAAQPLNYEINMRIEDFFAPIATALGLTSGGTMSDAETTPAADPIALTSEQMDALRELAWIRDEARDLKKREDQLRKEINAFLADADTGLDPDGKAVVKVKRMERSGVDSKKLEAMYPDIFENVRTTTAYSRIDLHVE